MRGNTWGRRVALLALCGVAAGLVAPRFTARAQDNAVAPEPVAFTLASKAPKGAVVLFGGKEADIQNNWYKRYTQDNASWTVDKAGVATPNKSDITSKQEFGDAYIHVEFRCPADAQGNPVTGGNAGVGLMGRYEVQILNSFGQKPEAHGCGALYSQTAPIVTASKKAGEWQTYDIIFRTPRFDANGQVTEKARATVFQNGIIVQDNQDFNGPTGIQYGEFKGEAKTGPIVLQGDHDPVQYRNVWVAPL